MVLSILLGVLAGVIGFIPLVVALRATKRHPEVGNVGPMLKLFLGLLISFVLLALFAILYAATDKGNALPFVLAEAIALSLCAIVYGIRSQRSHKEK